MPARLAVTLTHAAGGVGATAVGLPPLAARLPATPVPAPAALAPPTPVAPAALPPAPAALAPPAPVAPAALPPAPALAAPAPGSDDEHPFATATRTTRIGSANGRMGTSRAA